MQKHQQLQLNTKTIQQTVLLDKQINIKKNKLEMQMFHCDFYFPLFIISCFITKINLFQYFKPKLKRTY